MGFFDSMSRGFRFLKASYAMAFEDTTLLLPSFFLIVTTLVYTVGWVAVFVVGEIPLESQQGYALEAVAGLGSFTIFYVFMGMTVHLVDKHLAGEPKRLGEAFADAMQNFVAIFALALVSTLIELVSKAARRAAREEGGGAAIVGSMLVGFVESVWTIASYLLLPIIIIEDVSFGDALRRASAIHKGGLLQVGVGEFGVRIAANVVGFLVMIPLIFGAMFLFPISPIAAFVFIGFTIALLASFQVFVRMAFYTCLYHWAVATETQGREAVAPGPLAAAL